MTPRTDLSVLLTALLLSAACSDSSGPQLPEALVVRDSTVLAGLDYAATLTDVGASCGGNPTINCTGGNARTPVHVVVTRTAGSIARRTGPDSLIFDWTADLKVVSPAIPINITGAGDCFVTIDTRPGTDSTVHLTGTATFMRTRTDGPIDRMDIVTQTVTGLTSDDASLGGSLGCQLASLGLSFFTSLLEESLFPGYHLCGAPGSALFMLCRENTIAPAYSLKS